ncbi:hypothetical protein GCM10010435_53490 [Winogradskya consettensis]|uniref:Prolyl oligopeptidase n=1 Tax=Winogradskya consettensis TaxID=113560 RepID=A0A919SIF2_9ACTN|nr:prolyl oligopeptidase family serine peptidase [Actinoplanes consettensis]GIM71573.1 hypothetical protein Aco04nite_25950 [Actinoplanes consettensis]
MTDDPFRWLEDPDHPRTQEWLADQQNELWKEMTGTDRDGWADALGETQRRTAGLPVRPPVERGPRTFRQERTQHTDHVITVELAGVRKVLVDPTRAGARGKLAGWNVDPTGILVAVQIHEAGREGGGLWLYDSITGDPVRFLPDAAPYAAVTWLGDWLAYTGGTRADHRLRALRVPDGDITELRLPIPGPVRAGLSATPDGTRLLLQVRAAAGRPAAYWLARWRDGAQLDWIAVPVPLTGIADTGMDNGRLYLAGTDVIGIELAALEAGRPVLPEQVLGPQDGSTIGLVRLLRGPDGRTALLLLRRESTSRVVQLWDPGPPPRLTGSFRWPAAVQLGDVAPSPGRLGDAAWMLAEDPRYGAWLHRITAGDPLTMPGVEHSTLREFVSVSADGTQVPITVAEPDAGAIRTRPTLMTVYGGFGISLEPGFDLMLATWLDAGGRVAWVHARGGSERGEPWAAAGRGAGKHNTVADFRAAARHLADQGYVRAGQLTAMGVSNGGLVVASAMTSEPELFSAVVGVAPLADMLRYHLGGLGGTWLREYGDPDDPAAAGWLVTYSPLHQVRPNRRYPSVLLATGANDDRVPPWHAWKLSMALQQANTADTKVLLDHDLTSGHRGRDGLPGHLLAVHVLTLLSRATGLHAPALPASVDALSWP